PSSVTSLRGAGSASRGRVGQEGHLTRVLHGARDLTLLLDGDTRDAARTDLPAVRDELAQERGVLVVDDVDLRGLQRVGLLLGLAENGLGHRGGSLSGAVPPRRAAGGGWSCLCPGRGTVRTGA